MNHKRSAAGLAGWSDDFEAFCGEDARGSCVDMGEEDLLDAASEHTDSTAGSTCRRDFLGHGPVEVCGDGREQRVHGREAPGEEFEEAGGSDEGLQAQALIEQERTSHEPESSGIGERCEEESAEETVGGGAGDVAFNLGAGVLDELIVLDAGGTGGHAGHAAKTIVHMGKEVLIESGFALRGFGHHIDAATG